jgi:hypothetical protein
MVHVDFLIFFGESLSLWHAIEAAAARRMLRVLAACGFALATA